MQCSFLSSEVDAQWAVVILPELIFPVLAVEH
jgi:hypothetical protein